MHTTMGERATLYGIASATLAIASAYLLSFFQNIDVGHVTFLMTSVFVFALFAFYTGICAFSKKAVSASEARVFLAALLAFLICVSGKNILIATPQATTVRVFLPQGAAEAGGKLCIHEIVVDGSHVDLAGLILPEGWTLVDEKAEGYMRIKEKRIETGTYAPLELSFPPASYIRIVFNQRADMKGAVIVDGVERTELVYPDLEQNLDLWPVHHVKSNQLSVKYEHPGFCLRFGLMFLVLWVLIGWSLTIFRNAPRALGLFYSLFFAALSAITARRYLFDDQMLADAVTHNPNDRGLLYWSAQATTVLLMVLAGQVLTSFIAGCDYRAGFHRGFWAKAIVFGLLYWVLMVFLWPGEWHWDEFWLQAQAAHLKLNYYYHFLSCFLMLVAVMALPSFCGYILLQMAAAVLIVGYGFYLLDAMTRNGRAGWLLFGVLLTPYLVRYSFHPYRNTLYGYLLLFLFLKLIALYKGFARPGWLNIGCIAVLLAIASSWRPEGILFLVMVPVAMALTLRARTGVRPIAIVACLSLVLFLAIWRVQEGNPDRSNSYLYVNSIMPLSLMVHMELDPATRDRDFALIGRVIDIDVLKEYPSAVESQAWWHARNRLQKQDRTPDDDIAYFKGWFMLVLHNPTAFLRARWLSFREYPLIPTQRNDVLRTGFHPPNPYSPWSDQFAYYLAMMYPEFHPIQRDLPHWCDRVISLDFPETRLGRAFYWFFYKMLYFLVPLLNMLLLAAAAIRRNLPLLILEGMLFYGFLTVFLFAPAVKPLYYFPYFLPVLVVNGVIGLAWLGNRRGKCLSRNNCTKCFVKSAD